MLFEENSQLFNLVPEDSFFAQNDGFSNTNKGEYVSPGDIISAGGMRGHGTRPSDNDDEKLVATLAGHVDRIDRLVCVIGKHVPRYAGAAGDVVIGRVAQISAKKWKVDIGATSLANLPLSALNLPGGELRRRGFDDEIAMRAHLTEGDILSAEVHKVREDGYISLHTRSLKYGRINRPGCVIKVKNVKRCKTHWHDLPCGVSVIVGANGWIWIGPPISYSSNDSSIDRELRENMARIRNSILALDLYGIEIYDTSIMVSWELSGDFEVKELIKPAVTKQLASLTNQRLKLL